MIVMLGATVVGEIASVLDGVERSCKASTASMYFKNE